MKEVHRILNQVEDCISNNFYVSVETEQVELKPTPPNLTGSKTLLESVCAFLNTEGGILIMGIKDLNNVVSKRYEITGYREDFENTLKLFSKQFTDKDFQTLDLSEFIHYSIEECMGQNVCAIYVDKLPGDQKFAFFDKVAYKRLLTGDHKIDSNTIEKYEEFKEEIRNARELEIVPQAQLEDIDIDKLNDYIYLLNTDVKVESPKPNIESAKSFLTRRYFILGEKVTTLGMLVCGRNVKDFLGWRAEVYGQVDVESPNEVLRDKKILVDNVIPLINRSVAYVLRNIQTGVGYENGGTNKSEYPEQLLRETINNAIAHRDYSIDKYITLTIKPNSHIEIRNPGAFKKQFLLENLHHAIPIRRIIPGSKPSNPKLADLLRIFGKWEGITKGMSYLVNEALANRIDLPYYRIFNKDELGLFIPKGELVDAAFLALLQSFDLFIDNQLKGGVLSPEEIAVLAYFYKSEKANTLYRHTILLTPDNNHIQAIQHLEVVGLIEKHPESPDLHPVFLVNRTLLQDNHLEILREVFGSRFDALPILHRQILSLVYHHNKFSKSRSVNATQASRLLYQQQRTFSEDLKAFDVFRRKVSTDFRKLIKDGFMFEKSRLFFINLPN